MVLSGFVFYQTIIETLCEIHSYFDLEAFFHQESKPPYCLIARCRPWYHFSALALDGSRCEPKWKLAGSKSITTSVTQGISKKTFLYGMKHTGRFPEIYIYIGSSLGRPYWVNPIKKSTWESQNVDGNYKYG